MRKYCFLLGDWLNVIYDGKFFIKLVYVRFRGDVEDIVCKDNIYFNFVFLRIVFIVWFVLLGKLRIKDILFGCYVIYE